LIIYDGDNNFLFSNKVNPLPFDFSQIINGFYAKENVVLLEESALNDWKYVSIVPKSEIYKVPFLLSVLTAVLIIISCVIGIALTYQLTKRNYSLIMGVISIVEAAEKNEELS
jgi:two-component system sensor histidine kinase YesM